MIIKLEYDIFVILLINIFFLYVSKTYEKVKYSNFNNHDINSKLCI